jgi:hypothetical protein
VCHCELVDCIEETWVEPVTILARDGSVLRRQAARRRLLCLPCASPANA